MDQNHSMRIGVIDQSVEGWAAGRSYTKSLLLGLTKALSQRPDIEAVFLSRDSSLTPPVPFKVEKFPDHLSRRGSRRWLRRYDLDVVLPIRDFSISPKVCPSIGWIPDFQHEHLPEYTSETHLKFMRSLLGHLARNCTLILLSSETSKRHFETHFPDFKHKSRVASFTSNLWAEKLSANPVETVTKYNLPPDYGLVANQFWAHKNHQVLPEALKILKSRNAEVQLVLTGLPADFRDPENKTISHLFQACHAFDVHRQIHFLGKVPYLEMVNLMRASNFVLQPSLWEGWSTSIEDAKALGKALVCSDLEVHKEQIPEADGFFNPSSPDQLASVLERFCRTSGAGWNRERETRALSAYEDKAARFGHSLMQISEEAAQRKKRHFFRTFFKRETNQTPGLQSTSISPR
jgi:glycosyltransferase involved in cell wall biosynthesis